MQEKFPYRQIHLDFHNSPLIADIGADFDPEKFAGTLKSAHVDSVTVFGKCHHGYSYYPSQVGTPHPHLRRDLLGEMIPALHCAGIRALVYTTVVWDDLAWYQHPEWRVVFAEKPVTAMHISNSPLQPGWKELCMNTGFADYVIAQMLEIQERYDGDGFWVDIIQSRDCVCNACMTDMQAQGIDPADRVQRQQFQLSVARRFMRRASQTVWEKDPGQALYFNNRMRMITPVEAGVRPEMANFSHIELETLPAVMWGYEHFPIYARYFQGFEREMVGITSRFDTVWGDFGGFRNRAALEYECFQALALGAACKIGDQMHPRGVLDADVYRLIGEVYGRVKELEPWCRDTKAVAEIGVFTAASLVKAGEGIPEVDKGAWRLLEQLKYQFQFIDEDSDLEAYALVILPDEIRVDEPLAEKLRAYLAGGGTLLVSGQSGLIEGGFRLAEEMGVQVLGPAQFTPDYLVPGRDMAADMDVSHTVCYLPGVRIAAMPGAKVLATMGAPYFNRTWEHFTSHQYAPMERITEEPLIVQKDRVITIARPLFSDYAMLSRRPHRHILDHCIRRLLPSPWVGAHNLPVTAAVTVRAQGEDLIVHVLHYQPQRRSRMLDVLEDVVPLHDVSLQVKVMQAPEQVRLVPQGQAITWSQEGEYVQLRIPVVNGHQVVQIVRGLPG